MDPGKGETLWISIRFKVFHVVYNHKRSLVCFRGLDLCICQRLGIQYAEEIVPRLSGCLQCGDLLVLCVIQNCLHSVQCRALCCVANRGIRCSIQQPNPPYLGKAVLSEDNFLKCCFWNFHSEFNISNQNQQTKQFLY